MLQQCNRAAELQQGCMPNLVTLHPTAECMAKQPKPLQWFYRFGRIPGSLTAAGAVQHPEELLKQMQRQTLSCDHSAAGCMAHSPAFWIMFALCVTSFSLHVAGAQCNRAAELFEQMQQQGCTPDVVTFTALISAYEKGGQWRRALAAYEMMRQQHCKPDAIVYNAIIDALWETGVVWAQRKALVLYQVHLRLRSMLLLACCNQA